MLFFFFFFQAEDGIRDTSVTGVQTCAIPIFNAAVVAAMDEVGIDISRELPKPLTDDAVRAADAVVKIGRASCRERGESPVVTGPGKETTARGTGRRQRERSNSGEAHAGSAAR